MDYQFSKRVLTLKPSAIREIFKYAADPSVISLSAGNPAPEAFPTKAIQEISAKLLQENPVSALQYSVTEGYTPLREAVGEFMRSRHQVGGEGDTVLITSGAQQAADLFTKTIINEGDSIICEAPSFIGVLNTFRSYKANLIGVPVEADGMNIELLEQALQKNPGVRFIYTIPNFQNPSGVTMSMEKRRAVYALAKKFGVLILEDNPYADLRFAGTHIPAIKSMDTDGIVMYMGSFSKVISPGMRVGYAIGPNAIIQKMVVCKQGEDVHTNIWSQIICHRFMTQYDFDGHLASLKDIYRDKYQVLRTAMEKNFSPKLTYNDIEGGLFVWCTLPEQVDMPAFCKQAVLNKVCVVPGNAFMTDESAPCSSFRINYSTPTNEQLVKGIEILGKMSREF